MCQNDPPAVPVEETQNYLGPRKALKRKIAILGLDAALLITQILVESWFPKSIGIHFTQREVKYMKFKLVFQDNQGNQ